ncbi:MAG: formate dehydrogenase accessory sulfurtransferase FdhD [Candidatus Cryosericum sp.]
MMIRMLRYSHSGVSPACSDEVIEERPVTIYVNGTFAGQIASSGDLAEAAAVGHAVSQGWARFNQILSTTAEAQSAFLTLSEDAPGPGSASLPEIDCISGDESTDPAPLISEVMVSPSHIQMLADEMQHRATVWSATGGVHAALVSQGDNIFCCEDISRHTALDKVIGYALLHSWDLSHAVLLGTGRIPAQAVVQAARAGIPVLASRSATTAQAVLLAERLHLTLVAFVRAGRMNVYTHPERIAL